MEPIGGQRVAHQKRKADSWVEIELGWEKRDVGISYHERTTWYPAFVLAHLTSLFLVGDSPGRVGNDRGPRWLLRQ